MLVVVMIASLVVLGALIVALAVAVSWRRELGRAAAAIRSLDAGPEPGADRRRDPHR